MNVDSKNTDLRKLLDYRFYILLRVPLQFPLAKVYKLFLQ
jgi:hypothetical protein